MTTEAGGTTTRGLIDAELGPLRRFTGILDSMPTEKQTYGEGENARESTRVSINLKELDVKEAVEPYHFPTYTIRVSLSNRKKSRWGVLSEGTLKDRSHGFNNVADQQYSAEQFEPDNANYIQPKDRMDMEKHCIGKRIGFVLTDGIDGRPESMDLYDGRANEGAGGDVPTPAWTVYEIEGVGVAGGGGNSAMDLALGMLDSKTLADFNTAALANPVIRADVALLQSISKPPTAPDSFANAMVTAGKVTKDEATGIFHKVG